LTTRRRKPTVTPLPELRISDVETLRVLADPLRLRILEVFGQHGVEPLTVKTMARSLNEPLTKLYYHVNLLEQHGLLLVASSRLVSGILEKRYLPAAHRIEVDKSIVATGPPVQEAIRSIFTTLFDATVTDLDDAIHSGRASLAEDQDPDDGGEPILLSKGIGRLSHADGVEFRRRLTALYEEFASRAGEADAGTAEAGHPYGLVVAFYPMAEPPPRRRRASASARRPIPKANSS
jgi:hypothetical protein